MVGLLLMQGRAWHLKYLYSLNNKILSISGISFFAMFCLDNKGDIWKVIRHFTVQRHGKTQGATTSKVLADCARNA